VGDGVGAGVGVSVGVSVGVGVGVGVGVEVCDEGADVGAGVGDWFGAGDSDGVNAEDVGSSIISSGDGSVEGNIVVGSFEGDTTAGELSGVCVPAGTTPQADNETKRTIAMRIQIAFFILKNPL